MGKVDFKKSLDAYRAKVGEFRIVEVPELHYIMIDGQGDPNTAPEYRDAVETLFPVAYKLKFVSKRELDRDYTVMPLEGLWWADDMDTFTVARDTSQWCWTMMIMAPEWIDQAMLDRVVEMLSADGPPRLRDVRLEPLAEGQCVQTLHVGPFDAEGPVLETMHRDFIPSRGLKPRGKHHEIYLSDPRRTAPEKLRTILRQPVQP